MNKYFKFDVRTIVAIGIGSALFFLLAKFVSFPIFANTYLTFQYAVLAFFAAVFGPVAGLLIGLIGHALNDLTSGYGLWWSWIIVSALIGCAGGFVLNSGSINEGKFGDVSSVVRFVIGCAVIHLLGWGVVAPLLDILIYAEPMELVFAQGWIAGAVNLVTTAVVGTLLLIAYGKTRTGTGSLSKS